VPDEGRPEITVTGTLFLLAVFASTDMHRTYPVGQALVAAR
jgi:hypothetical protein